MKLCTLVKYVGYVPLEGWLLFRDFSSTVMNGDVIRQDIGKLFVMPCTCTYVCTSGVSAKWCSTVCSVSQNNKKQQQAFTDD